MSKIIDAVIDRNWPRMTDVQRANYLARKELEKNAPAPRWAVMLAGALFIAIPLLYCVSASAGPVVVAPLSAAAAVAQRNNESKPDPEVWKDGPCKGQVRAGCTWFVNGVEQK